MKRLFYYLNPIERLGNTRYSFLFPLIANITISILSEFYAYQIAKNPMSVGSYIIFLNAAFIIYFSFRDGIMGGLTSSFITVIYYIYIITTRHYSGQLLVSGVDTTITLGVLYFILSGVIGFLKQTIDKLIEKEENARVRLETILDQLPTGIIISNPLGMIEFINSYTYKLFGDSLQVGDVVGKATKSALNGKNKQAKISDLPSVQDLLRGKAIKKREFVFERPNGDKFYINSHASPIKNEQGKIIAVASISNDITSQKELEQRKDDFIDMASHEFKTPLTSIKVFTQVLEKQLNKKKDSSSAELVRRVNVQLDKLTILVSDLLDITRMQKGKIMVEQEKFFIRKLAEEVMQDLQPISRHKLELKWTTNLPVYADKERIRQVLTNLVTNAIKYAQENTKIIIGSRKNKDTIEIYVQDFGIGISKTEQNKIFTRFYQVAEHSTYPGLGLGLFISSQIIKQHKGKLWVESEENKGSTFWFSLPIYKEDSIS